MANVLIGSDPEVFLSQNGQIISAIGLIGGDKKAPVPVVDGALQEDNVLAEVNITPAASVGEFISRLRSVLNTLQNVTKSDIVIKPSHVFEKEYLMSIGGKAMTFGCEPDYCVYSGRNPRPSPYSCLRTAGGHIHVGSDDIDPVALVKTMDRLLALPSLFMDTDQQRRERYGKAGCYRLKPYGVEYRTLSNFWLQSEELMTWAYNTTIKAVEEHKKWNFDDDNLVVEAINTYNLDLANDLIHSYEVQ